MYEFIQLTDRSYYINCPAKIGVFRLTENEVCLIDSGNDKDAGRRVRKILDEQGWKLHSIVNTHSNADHIGGNKYLQQNTGCRVFADGIETAFTRYPMLEPSFLYGGYPNKDLRHKFLLAQESAAEDISSPDFPKGLEVIPLRGHFFHMIGLRTADDVVFLADCISSAATLEKYKIGFIYDIPAYLETLDRVEAMEAAIFVPAHAEATRDIKSLVRLNRETVLSVADKILELLKTPMNPEELLKAIFDEYKLVMNFEQYVLVGSTLRSYLSWLYDSGKISAAFEGNMLKWSVV